MATIKATYRVTVEATHVSGVFASRDEITEQIADALESADPGSLSGDEGGEYEISEYAVDDVTTETKVNDSRLPDLLTACRVLAKRHAREMAERYADSTLKVKGCSCGVCSTIAAYDKALGR